MFRICNNSPTITDKLFYVLKKFKSTTKILLLLIAGADVNGTDSDGNSPLMLACLYPTEDVAKLLIAWKANIHRPDPTTGWTVLHFAVFKGWLKLIKLLVKKGANLDAENVHGSVPLVIAANVQNKDAFEMLVTFGANVDYLNCRKWSVLHFASQSGWLGAVQASLKRNIYIDTKNDLGDTPLRMACDNNHLEVVEYLLKTGANCREPNLNGKAPFDFLIARCCVEPIKMCIENGAFIKDDEYVFMLNKMMLRKYVLRDVDVCCQSIINKFNSKDLPNLYRIPMCRNNLPKIEDLKILKLSEMAQDVKQAVTLDKQVTGYINLKEVCPIVLRMMCVKSILHYYQPIVKEGEMLEKIKKFKIKKSKLI